MTKHHYNKKLDIPQDADSVRYFIPEGYTTARLEDGVLIIEPKESEGEKIRKEIVSFIRDFWVDHRDSVPQTSKWLDWLEKQKEQKLFPKFKVGDTIRCKYDDREFTIKSVDLEAGVYKYTKEGCGNDIDYADEDFELVEQKPEWGEEDEINLKMAIGKFEGTACDLEWDLEQRVIKWLKSLKNRGNSPQSNTNSPSWSEEDEKQIRQIERIVKNAGCSKMLQEKIHNWLKSLRNRLKSSDTWKPSAEQMAALLGELPIVKGSGDKAQNILESLYDDLTKLI